MLKERLELIECEINKLTKELEAMYEQIAIKRTSDATLESSYDTKYIMLTQLMLDQKVIKEILRKNPNV